MAIFFFPQWQGSFKDNRLYASAQTLQAFIKANFAAPTVHFIDIPLSDSASSELENNILARRAIIEQAATARAILEREKTTKLFMLGGDCGVEVMPITILNSRYESNFAVIWIDAHADLNTPETSPSHTFHGMVLRAIFGEGDSSIVQQLPSVLMPQQVILLGARDFDPAEKAFAEAHFISGTNGFSRDNIQNDVVSLIQARGYQNIYVHFDLDAFDPHDFPYIDYPTPNGPTIQNAMDTLDILANAFNIVGMGITEYASDIGQGLDVLTPLMRFFVEKSNE